MVLADARGGPPPPIMQAPIGAAARGGDSEMSGGLQLAGPPAERWTLCLPLLAKTCASKIEAALGLWILCCPPLLAQGLLKACRS